MLGKLDEHKYRHETKGYSQSQLKRFLDISPQQWRYEQQYPPETTPAMVNGTLAHEIALEGLEAFEKYYLIDNYNREFNKTSRRGKAYDDYKEKLLSSEGADKKIYIKAEDLDRTKKVAQVIKDAWGHESKTPLLAQEGQAEVAIYGIKLGGALVKGKLDWIPSHKPILCDLKTTGLDLDDRSIKRKLLYEGWDIQAAFYHDLFLEETGKSRHFIFMIANTKTYQTRTVKLSPECDLIKEGRRKYLKALEEINLCEESETWAGYPIFDASTITIGE